MDGLVEKFKDMGFTKYEALTYLTLLAYGPLTARGISQKAQIPYNRTYDIVASLIKKGFVQELKGKTRLFVALDPDIAFLRYSKSVEALKNEVKSAVEKLKAEEQEKYIIRFSSIDEILISLKGMVEKTNFEFSLVGPPKIIQMLLPYLKKRADEGISISIYSSSDANIPHNPRVFFRETTQIGHTIAFRDSCEVLVIPSMVFEYEAPIPMGFKSNFPEIIFAYYIYLRDIFEESKAERINVDNLVGVKIKMAVMYHVVQIINTALKKGLKVKVKAIVKDKKKEQHIIEGVVKETTYDRIVNNIKIYTGENDVLVGGPFAILENYESTAIELSLE